MRRNFREGVYLYAVLIVGLLGCLAYASVEYYYLDGNLGFPLDDSWIHLQFARNLSNGDGLTYNPGEGVAGSTAPLWTALLSIFFLIGGPVVVWVKLAGSVLMVASLHAVYRLGRELDLTPPLAALAAALTGLTSWILWAALSGMEIPLFVFLSVWGMVFHLRERRRNARSAWAFALFGLSALARPEGALLAVLAVVDRVVVWDRSEGELRVGVASWQAVIKGACFGLVFIAPMVVLNWRLSSSPLPTTFGAKAGGLVRWLPDVRYLYEVISIFLNSQPYMLFLALGGVVVLLERLGTKRDRGLLPGLWLVCLPLVYSLISPPGKYLVGNFGRYFYPLFPVLTVLGTLALARLARAVGGRLVVAGLRIPLRAVTAALILWPTVSTATFGAGRYVQAVANIEDGDVKIAKWLAERVDPRALLAVNDVGALKYFLPNRVIDLAGIIHPRISRYIEEARAEQRDWRLGVLRILDETEPDFLVIFPEWYPGIEGLNERFVPQFELEIPANIASGGNRIVVYSTPWTRYPLNP